MLLSNLNLCLPMLSTTDHNYGITALHNYGFTVLRQVHIIKTYGTQKEESSKNHNFATFRCASSPTHRSHNQESVHGRTHCSKAKRVRRTQAKVRWSCKGRGLSHLRRLRPPIQLPSSQGSQWNPLFSSKGIYQYNTANHLKYSLCISFTYTLKNSPK